MSAEQSLVQAPRRPSQRTLDSILARDRPQIIQEIYNEILGSVIEPKSNDPHRRERAFICSSDLHRIWADISRIAAVVYPQKWPRERLYLVKEKLILCLSILSFIGAEDILTTLFPLDADEPKFTDQDLSPDGIDHESLSRVLPPAQCQLFYEKQFYFIPEIIKETIGQSTQVVNQKKRLPFKYIEENIGGGSYGEVSHIEIPSGYIKREESRHYWSSWDRALPVAVKKIEAKNDFFDETKNLQILKESIRHHDRIMLHQVTIHHGINHYILFPYAEYGDLELFLHCGKAPGRGGQNRYDWSKRFPTYAKISDDNLPKRILPLLNQCSFLADALAWLHREVTVKQTSKKLFFAHMDLKPANILIRSVDEVESIVGKWVISDFGISAFKEETGEQDNEYGTVGDYYTHLTMNTKPKRGQGTYQAPEVEAPNAFGNNSSELTAEEKRGIGRKSDVWSFGCILSEILAFALGRDELVTKFQMIRKASKANDYFYSSASSARSQYLAAPNHAPQYNLREAVTEWLDQLSSQYPNPGNWIQCYTTIIKTILTTNPRHRPRASKVKDHVEHAKRHIAEYDSRGPRCSILRPLSSPTDALFQSGNIPFNSSPPQIPQDHADFGQKIVRQTTFDEEVLLDPELSGQLSHPSVTALRPRSEFSQAVTSPEHSSYTSSGRDPTDRLTHPAPGKSMRPHQRPVDAHGIAIEPDVPRQCEKTTVTAPVVVGSHKKVKATDTAISHTGEDAAFLIGSTVYLRKLDLATKTVTHRDSLDLDRTKVWNKIALSGNYLVAWGYTRHGVRPFCCYDLQDNTTLFDDLPQKHLSFVSEIALSPQGTLALVGDRMITVMSERSSDTTALEVEEGEYIAHAAFNNTGDLLFGWAYGRSVQRQRFATLYVWMFRNGEIQFVDGSGCHYRMDESWSPNNYKLLPYNSFKGCIIIAPDRHFAPLLTGRSRRHSVGWDDLLSPNWIMLEYFITGCFFRNHSFITIERGRTFGFDRRPKLREYQVNYGETHTFTKAGQKLCSLESDVDKNSRVRAIQTDDNKIVVIICNPNSVIEFVEFVPVTEPPST